MLTSLINNMTGRPARPPRVADPESLRATPLGPVIGLASKHNTHSWLGIPYAQPPVGGLRWKAPRAPLAWSEPKAALACGPIAMQFAGETIGAPEKSWGSIVGSEDCLTLNVYAPRMAPPEAALASLPVMVWIHGGGNTVGTAAAFPVLRNLAGQDQVLVVSMNYRLGIFGWFSLAELATDGDSAEDRSGNFGTLDIIAALKWVQQNIAAFGGDPANVTVFGESAGGLNVYSLLASPLAKGLFHKAIAQSPLTLSCSIEQARAGFALSSGELLGRWQCAPGELRARPAAELLAAITPGPLGFYDAPQLLRDGTVLPLAPMQELFADASRYNAVPVIIGSNRDEYKLFMAKNPEFVRMVFGKLPLIRDRAGYERYGRYMSDLWKAACVDQPAASMVASGNANVWVYRFDWDEYPDVPFIHPPALLGANHALEMAFVMRDVDGEIDPFRCATKGNRTGRQHVSDAMAGYWTSFARSGAPNAGAGLPEWQRWRNQADADKLMLFDSDAGGGVRMDKLQLSADGLGRALGTDPAFQSQPRERVKLYARMFSWSAFVERISPAQFSRFAQEHAPDCSAEEFRPLSWP